jgi:hemerythrin
VAFAPPLQWKPSLAVGDERIDAQHQELFRRAERLITALRGNDRSEVEQMVGFLADYVNEHFSAEERLMTEAGYPELAAHRTAHEKFKNEYAALMADFHEKGPTALVAITLHNWLSSWLKKHLTGADLEMARWLRARRA